jgi:hypothetical protein
MKLYHLLGDVCLQGNVKVTRFDENDNTEDRFFHEVENLTLHTKGYGGVTLADWEDLEVTYMFTSKTCQGAVTWLSIEVSEPIF